MNDNHRVFWLTGLQGMMVVTGLGIFFGIKEIFKQVFMVASLLGDPVFSSPTLNSLSVLLGFPLALLAGRNVASIAYRAGRRKRQAKWNIQAARLVDRVRQGHDESFSLYLRSFSSEGRWKRKKGISWYLCYEGDILGIDSETLELSIASGARGRFPMITVAESGSRLGAGRLPSAPDEWKDLVRLLTSKAKVVYVVPGTSEGVLWEMEYPCREHRARTLYVMPSSVFYQDDAGRGAQEWSEARFACAARGIELPAYDSKGLLFTLDGRGNVDATFPFSW